MMTNGYHVTHGLSWSDKLDTCGHCKSEAVLDLRRELLREIAGDHTEHARIRCTGCGIRGLWHPTVEQAIEVWNKRVGESDD
jgi:DNA-directed RNA polymerase subunit RPC12/RpoP